MTWLAALGRIGALLSRILDWLRARRTLKAARAEATARHLREVVDALDKARNARGDAAAGNDASGLRTDDGHRRD